MSLAKFRYLDRQKRSLLVLIPGWASDYRIFTRLNLEFNYLIPVKFFPFTFGQDLFEVLTKNGHKKVSLFGWSLGGFIGAEFAAKFPNLIDEIILASIRKRYKSAELAEVRKHLSKNKQGYLYKFYTQCFSKKDKADWFRENLLKDYCRDLDLDYLQRGLDYLENAQIKPKLLNKITKITIIHGEADCIAPIAEAMEIKNSLAQARFICLKQTGHLPFLKEDFAKYI